MKRLLILICGFAALNIVAACGQSGPLYLPGNPSEIRTPQELPTEEESDEKKSEEDDEQ